MPGPTAGWRSALGHRRNGECGSRGQAVTHNMDSGFAIIVKLYFKLIQVLHHMEILSVGKQNGTLPPGMQRQLIKLSGFIKPACPTENISNKVWSITKDWIAQILMTLLEHYEMQKSTLLVDKPDWNLEAFNKATHWARNRYKKKLTDSSVSLARHLLERGEDCRGDGMGCEDTPVGPRNTSGVEESRLRTFSDTPVRPSDMQVGSSRTLVGQGRTVITPRQTLGERITTPEREGLSFSEVVRRSPVIRKDGGGVIGGSLDLAPGEGGVGSGVREVRVMVHREISEEEWPLLTTPHTPHTSPCTPVHTPTRTEGQMQNQLGLIGTSVPTHLSVNFDLDFSFSDSSSLEIQGETATGGPDVEPRQTTREAESTGMMCSPIAACLNVGNGGASESSSSSPSSYRVDETEGLGGVAQDPTPPLFAPTSHMHTTRKTRDWHLVVEKPMLIVGDSNLRHISFFINPNLQIDSFPGARFDHLREIFDKVKPNGEVQLVILAAGINDLTRQKEILTIWKEFLRALHSCERAFPNAVVYVPQLNFSNRLTIQVQNKIEEFNKRVVRKCRSFSPLPESEFRVGSRDPIHWTKETGLKLLDHWMAQLNSLGGEGAFHPLL